MVLPHLHCSTGSFAEVFRDYKLYVVWHVPYRYRFSLCILFGGNSLSASEQTTGRIAGDSHK